MLNGKPRCKRLHFQTSRTLRRSDLFLSGFCNHFGFRTSQRAQSLRLGFTASFGIGAKPRDLLAQSRKFLLRSRALLVRCFAGACAFGNFPRNFFRPVSKVRRSYFHEKIQNDSEHNRKIQPTKYHAGWGIRDFAAFLREDGRSGQNLNKTNGNYPAKEAAGLA